MPGYSRIDIHRGAGPLLVMGLDPATGELASTQVIQCDGCGTLTTTFLSNEHDNLHGLLQRLLDGQTALPVTEPTGVPVADAPAATTPTQPRPKK